MTDEKGKTERGKLEPPNDSNPAAKESGRDRDVFNAPTVIGQATEDILALVKAAAEGGPRPPTVPPVPLSPNPREQMPTLPAGAITAADVAAAAGLDSDWGETGDSEEDEPPPSQRMTLPPTENTEVEAEKALAAASQIPTPQAAAPAFVRPPMGGPTGTVPLAWKPQGPLPSPKNDAAASEEPPSPKIPQSAVETVAIRRVKAGPGPVFIAMVAAVTLLFVGSIVVGLLMVLR